MTSCFKLPWFPSMMGHTLELHQNLSPVHCMSGWFIRALVTETDTRIVCITLHQCSSSLPLWLLHCACVCSTWACSLKNQNLFTCTLHCVPSTWQHVDTQDAVNGCWILAWTRRGWGRLAPTEGCGHCRFHLNPTPRAGPNVSCVLTSVWAFVVLLQKHDAGLPLDVI